MYVACLQLALFRWDEFPKLIIASYYKFRASVELLSSCSSCPDFGALHNHSHCMEHVGANC